MNRADKYAEPTSGTRFSRGVPRLQTTQSRGGETESRKAHNLDFQVRVRAAQPNAPADSASSNAAAARMEPLPIRGRTQSTSGGGESGPALSGVVADGCTRSPEQAGIADQPQGALARAPLTHAPNTAAGAPDWRQRLVDATAAGLALFVLFILALPFMMPIVGAIARWLLR